MSDLAELLDHVTKRLTDALNELILSSSGVLFGTGDIKPLAADIIDDVLNREFQVEEVAPPSSGWCDDPTCPLCRKEAQLMSRIGQCAECPYHLTGVFKETGCPNCPNREAA